MRIQFRLIGLVTSGIGLILIGVVFWQLLAVRQAQNAAGSPTDFAAVPAKVQFEAPSLTLSDLQNNRHSLSEYRGQVVLVNLWATWCPPCKAEMPILQDFYLLHKADGFTVIAIEDGDPYSDVASYVRSLNLTFSVWLDPTYQATDQAFKTANLPSSYVIDRDGVVRLTWVGAINLKNLEKYVTPLIKE